MKIDLSIEEQKLIKESIATTIFKLQSEMVGLVVNQQSDSEIVRIVRCNECSAKLRELLNILNRLLSIVNPVL